MKANFVVHLLYWVAAAAYGSTALAQSPGTFTATGKMTRARSAHTATLLPNGKVLLSGGFGALGFGEATAELYDPSTGAFAATGNMTTRGWHTATLLADGRVLIVGGFGGVDGIGKGSLPIAELYDTSTGTFTTTGATITALTYHTATLLRDGRVLIAGPAAAELYDPVSGAFTATGAYSVPGTINPTTATLLSDGKVLLTGSDARFSGGWTEMYDPSSGTFSSIGSIKGWYNENTATLLMNGKVLVAGSDEYPFPAEAEVYDPLTGTSSRIENMTAPHEGSAAVLLPDGTVLITGSQLGGGGADSSAELYHPASGTFSVAGNMTQGRFGHTATLLPDGKVLIAGSYSGTSTAELYYPAAVVPAPALLSLSQDGQAQGAILRAGTDRLASSSDPATGGEALEIYLTGLTDGGVIPPQVVIGGRR
ncbi:MAG: kelch motif-containing protein, partial [Acidobacteriota bacterium]|nr:kelch motif-containing protein [Acidobacteriota bacterium]